MKLIEYLEHARKLENDIYLCDNILNALNNKISVLEVEQKEKIKSIDNQDKPKKEPFYLDKPKKPKIDEENEFKGDKSTSIGCLGFLLWAVLNMCLLRFITNVNLIGGVGIVSAIVLWLIFDKLIKLYKSNYYKHKLKDYERELKTYNDLLELENEEYDVIYSKFKDECNKQKKIVNDYYNEKYSGLKKTMQPILEIKSNIEYTLQRIYSTNVIYPKYRSLVPVTMFCEYLASGRCSALEGHEGAYNIYENELRQNIIISKLDTIASKLDSIKSSQYLLYTSISEANRLSGQMISSFSAYSDQHARANALQELSNKAILDSNQALQDLGQKTLDEIKKFNA